MLFPRQLDPPGSSSYSSDTLHVGDGTWDSSRDTFLLPNLQTLNYATMQYNGMGNRFRAMPGYHTLIKGHAILATIVFLGIVPAAVMIARFYRPNPRMAMRMHIYLQIITLFLVTVVFILGWFAVGPERSLTNPHHDIGLTIYVLIWFQILWGTLVYKREKGKVRYKAPVRLMLHQWLGRATALLALAQIGSGLYLYGSPRVLFILYGLALALLILLYFALSYRNQPVYGEDGGSYYTGTDMTPPRKGKSSHSGLKAAAGALGGAALIKAYRDRRRSREETRTDVSTSRPGSRHGSRHGRGHRHSASGSSYDDEKFSEEEEHGQHKWRNRVLGGVAAGGTLAAVRHWMKGRRGRDEASDVSSYQRPGRYNLPTQSDVSRVHAGLPPESPARLQRPQPGAALPPGGPGRTPSRPGYRRAGGSISSYTSIHNPDEPYSPEPESPEREHSHGLRNGIAALGVAGFARHLWNRRRQRGEDERVEDIRRQDRVQEEIARRNSRRRQGTQFTGDGSPSFRRPGLRPPPAGGSVMTLDDSAITGSNPALSRPHLGRPGTAAGPGQSSLAQQTMSTITPTHPPPSNIPLPPPPSGSAIAMPPPPPIQDPGYYESGSESYASPSGHQHRRHRLRDAAEAGAAGAAVGAAADHFHGRNDGVESPPVSVKVKMHNDGRHVTLRRLNEQEAAAEREARRRRGGSVSSLDGPDRWRRTEQMEAAQAAQMNQQQQQQHPTAAAAGTTPYPPAPVAMPYPGAPPPPPASQQALHDLPPPPPIPGAAGAGGSGIGAQSPPSVAPYGTETDLSNYENNRRRRRAERMKAKAAQQGGGSGRVEFQ